MSRLARAATLALGCLLAEAAVADVVLDGHQHIGNDDTTSDATSELVPPDPVTRAQILAYPSHFHVSQDVVVTGVTLTSPIGLDGPIEVKIDGTDQPLNFCAACATCTGRQACAASIDLTLTVPLALSAGVHTLAVDPTNSSNDIGFAALTLVSAANSISRNLNQRRNVGDDNDGNDDYDITSGDPWYPDASGGLFVEIAFTLDANRRLEEIQFRRLRDADTNNAQVSVDGLFIGNLVSTGDPLEDDPTTLSTSLLLLAGAHTLRIDAGTIGGGNRDTMSWDDILLLFAELTSPGTAGYFSAVDDGEPALTGVITTKVAGDARTLDFYAINGLGTAVETAYAGTADVYLLDAADNSGTPDIYGCRNWTVAQALGTVTFVAGAATLSPVFLDAGLREARIRVTDPGTGASGCSLDNFAVRPHSFGSIVASHDTETTAGTAQPLDNTGASGTPRHKAGQPFTIEATAVAASGNPATAYDGTPTLTGRALAPATVDGTVLVTSWIALGSGALRTDTAKYLEAGPVTLELSDSDYASVDADDTTPAQRTIGPGSLDAGRFIPDHFTLAPETVAPTFAAACGGFTYLGQPFGISPAPFRASITAVEANGAVTRNYTEAGLYPSPSVADTSYLAEAGTVSAVSPPSPDHTLANRGNGVTRFELLPTQFAFARGAEVPPFPAEIAIELGALTEADGVNFPTLPARFGAPTAGNGIPFTGAGFTPKQLRFGRLVVDNAHGSENLPLGVPLRVEYWNTGFQPSSDDNCTVLPGSDLQQFDATVSPAQTWPTDVAAGGRWTLTLAAPGTAGRVTIRAVIGADLPHLQADNEDADLLYNNDPQGLADFGVLNDRDRRIFQREVIGY